MASVNRTTLKGYFNTGDKPTEAQFENLIDSGINLTDGGTVVGDVIHNAGTAVAAGAGVSGAETNTWYVGTNSGITTTVGLIDITGLTSDSTDTGVIGDEGEAAAYFTQLTAAVNGYIYHASITCVEAPQGGEIDLDLVFDTTATAEGAAATDVVIPAAADWTLGLHRSSDLLGATHAVLTAGLADYYVHLAVGTSSGPVNGTYTHGKFAIILKGIKAF